MKRLAVLTLFAGLLWSGTAARAADPARSPAPPLPTGMAPTKPQVPVPVVQAGAVVPADGRTKPGDRVAGGSVRPVGYEEEPAGPRLLGRLSGLSLFGKGCKDGCEPCGGKKKWCDDCAPAVRTPLPPLPAGVGTVGCADGACRPAKGAACPDSHCKDGHCWARFKAWLCYRETPVHLGCHPTLRYAPLYWPCVEKAPCGAADCGPAGCVAPAKHRFPALLPARGKAAGGCEPCPAPAGPVMPGYRFAAPEGPAAVAKPAPGPVVTTSYRPTAPAPYPPFKIPGQTGK